MATKRGNMSLERFLVAQQSPTVRNKVSQMDISAKTSSMAIDFSLKLLNSALEATPLARSCTWICLKRLEQGGWLCSNGEEVIAVNFTRLFEMILYSRLANEYVIPSKPATNSFNIDAR